MCLVWLVIFLCKTNKTAIKHYHFYFQQRHPMRGEFITITFAFNETSNDRKIYITITFAFNKDIQWPDDRTSNDQMTGKSSLLLHLHSTKTSNDRKVYVTTTFVFNKTSNNMKVYIAVILCSTRNPMHVKFTLLSLLHSTKMIGKSIFLSLPMTSNDRKVYIAVTFAFNKDIQWQESLHCCHLCIQ